MLTRTTKPEASIKRIDPKLAAEAILAKAQSSRTVIQDFVPLGQSLEWNLGQEYLRQRGNKAFLSDASPVPFVVNNDGALSKNAAEVFFASCRLPNKALWCASRQCIPMPCNPIPIRGSSPFPCAKSNVSASISAYCVI